MSWVSLIITCALGSIRSRKTDSVTKKSFGTTAFSVLSVLRKRHTLFALNLKQKINVF